MNHRDITRLHQDICNLVRVGQQTDLALARCLAEMAVDRRYRECGAASMADYVRHHVVCVGEGKAHGLLAIGRRLAELPELAEAMENPEIGWTKVRQVARVAEPETVDGWLQAAANFTSRELEAATRAATTGDDAPVPEDRPRLQSRTIEFTVTPEMEDVLTRALSFRRAALGDDAGDLSREQVLWMILEQSMVADAVEIDVSAPRLQTIIQVCPSCDDAVQVGLPDGATAEVDESTRARACCDSVQVDMRPGKEGRSTQTVSAAARKVVESRDGHRCAAPKCRHRGWLEVHHVVHQSVHVDHRPSNLLLLCSAHHALHHDGYFNIELDSRGKPVFDFPDLSGRSGKEQPHSHAITCTS